MITPTPTDTTAPEAEIAQKIESRLAAKGLSRKSIHDAAGISRPTFDRSMAGGRSFTINELIRIASKLGVPAYEILPDSLMRDAA